MITENYVSFETAKLLKEKGFDEECVSVYYDGKIQLVSSLGVFCGEGYGEQILTYTNSECEWSPIMVSAPTLQMAMKWLREVHKLYMYTAFAGMEEVWFSRIYDKDKHLKDLDDFNTYEEAYEAGIKYILENLI